MFHSGGNLEFLINTNDKINIKGQTNDNQQKVQAIHAVVYEKKLLIELLSIESHVKLFYIHHGHFGFIIGTKITNLPQHVT